MSDFNPRSIDSIELQNHGNQIQTDFQTTDLNADAQKLYEISREIVAPVIAGFAHHLLREAGERKIIFAARDGLGSYIAAQELKQHFDYTQSPDDQLVYAYLSRKIVFGTEGSKLEQYLGQEGIQQNDNVVLADIGWYGSLMLPIKRVLPNADIRFLISRHPDIPGYADSPYLPCMASMAIIRSNTAPLFLEDTYSGPVPSPVTLTESDGQLAPNTLNDSYPTYLLLKREMALLAIRDYTKGLREMPPDCPDFSAISRLDRFLFDPANYEGLMIPHEQ